MPAFVITSEYTRKIAHELDAERERWLNVRSDSFLDFLPSDVVLLVPQNINHAYYLSDKVNLPKHYSDAMQDRGTLQLYLSQLKQATRSKNMRIHGKVVSTVDFFAHRDLVLLQLNYIGSLARRLKHQLKRQNIMRSNIRNGDIDRIDSNGLPFEVEIIRSLVRIIKEENKKNPFLADNSIAANCVSRAQNYMDGKIEEYLWDVTELYSDDVIDLDDRKARANDME